MNDDTYNGWKNRETWAAALWLNNDQGLQDLAYEAAAAGVAEQVADYARYELESTADSRAYYAGVAVVAFLEELLDPDGAYGPWKYQRDMATDIGSLWRVDEYELGAAFLEENPYLEDVDGAA